MISYDLRQLPLITTYEEETRWFKISTSPEKSKTNIRRILLVDDEPDVAITIKTVLEDSGLFEVDTFNNAESALSIFKPDGYVLAILDIKMPGMDGFELCRKLRKIDKKLKICFLTATELLYYRKTDSDVIDDLGVDCFLTKPVNNKQIIDRIESILSIEDMKWNHGELAQDVVRNIGMNIAMERGSQQLLMMPRETQRVTWWNILVESGPSRAARLMPLGLIVISNTPI